MNKKKLLNKLQEFLNTDSHKKRKQRDELKKVLKKLKKKENKIKDKIESCDDEDTKKQLEMELEIVHVQRKKGIAVLRGERPVESSTGEASVEKKDEISDVSKSKTEDKSTKDTQTNSEQEKTKAK